MASSSKSRVRISKAERAYNGILSKMAATILEFHICHKASRQDPFFIQAFEGGQVDCGLILESSQTRDGPGSTSPNSQRLMHYTKYGIEKNLPILPGEIKSATPCSDKSGCLKVMWEFTKQQWDKAAIVILGSIKDVNVIAMLPMAILHHIRASELPLFRIAVYEDFVQVESTKVRPIWTLHPLAAFPAELAPFLLPLNQVGQMCNNIKNAWAEGSSLWTNHHTGVKYDFGASLRSSPISVLNSDFEPHRKAQKYVNRLYKAFDNQSRFSIDFFQCPGVFGDCKLVDSMTGTQVFIELKTRHCSLERRPAARTQMQHHQNRIGYADQYIFCWKAQWDFLLTEVDGGREALFIPRDAVPKGWWNSKAQNRRLDWCSHTDVNVEDFVVSQFNNNRLRQDIERMLYRRDLPLWKAYDRIPVGTCADNLEDEYVPKDREIGIATKSYNAWSTRGSRRGFGPLGCAEMRGRTYQTWAAEALQEMCRNDGHTLVLNVGRTNSRYQFLIARYEWSIRDQCRYDETGEVPCQVWHFDKGTPVVPVTFIETEWGISSPQGSNRMKYTLPLISSMAPSIVICDAFPTICMRMAHGRYLLPSHLLPANQSAKAVHWKLTEGYLEDYYTDYNTIFEPFLRIMKNLDETTLGAKEETIRTSTYLRSLGQVLQETLDQCCPAADDDD